MSSSLSKALFLLFQNEGAIRFSRAIDQMGVKCEVIMRNRVIDILLDPESTTEETLQSRLTEVIESFGKKLSET